MAKEEDIDAFLGEMAEYVKGKFADKQEGAPAPPPKETPKEEAPPTQPPTPPKEDGGSSHGASKRWFG